MGNLIEQLGRIKSIMGIDELTVYRGIGNNMKYNDAMGDNEGFLWVAVDKSVAADYAEYDYDKRNHVVQQLEITPPTNPFKFPYKNNVHVKGVDMTNNLRLVRDQKYKKKEIDLNQYKTISDLITQYGEAAGDNLETFHTKIDKPGAAKKLAELLSFMGYDAIQIDTDRGATYGIIKN